VCAEKSKRNWRLEIMRRDGAGWNGVAGEASGVSQRMCEEWTYSC